jgi:hypothetical protein
MNQYVGLDVSQKETAAGVVGRSDRRPSPERCFGLEQYATSFRENNIDESVLPNLTAEDLKDLGIATVGHGQKLLDAISAGP